MENIVKFNCNQQDINNNLNVIKEKITQFKNINENTTKSDLRKLEEEKDEDLLNRLILKYEKPFTLEMFAL